MDKPSLGEYKVIADRHQEYRSILQNSTQACQAQVMQYSPTFSCLPMGTAFCFCTFAVRQSCLLAPAALAGAPGAVASVAAAVAFEPRAPPALAAALDLLLAGCFCKRHQTLLLLAKEDFESCASTGCADDHIADIEHEP